VKAILHIGTEKTGTTTLQSFLHTNKSQLLQQGIAVLESLGGRADRYLATYALDEDRTDDSHIPLGLTDPDKRRAWRLAFPDRVRSEVASLPQQVTLVVLSSEHCHSRLVRPSEVRRLKRFLDALFDECQIILYLRRQDKVAVSLYSTALRVGFTNRAVIGKPDANNPYYNYETLLDRWADVFGDQHIIPRILEPSRLHNGTLIADFCHVTGLPDPCDLLAVADRNVSLTATAQEFLRLFNQFVPGHACGQPHPLRGPIADYLEQGFSGRPRMPARQDAIQFYAAYRPSNDRVANRWFGFEHLFEEDFSSYPETAAECQFGFEDATKIAAYLWVRLMESNSTPPATTHEPLVKRAYRRLKRPFLLR